MGLDITAFRKLTAAPEAKLDADGFPEDYGSFVRLSQEEIDWTEGNWKGRTEGLTAGVYSFGEEFDFRAGSYGGYNQWRDMLCMTMRGMSANAFWADEKPGPFTELISFADNEGFIGPVVAAKLAKDFAENQERAEKTGDEWFVGRYRDWRKAFEMAADGGAVSFH